MGPTFSKGTPVVLFKKQIERSHYDVGPDGRFLYVDGIEPTVPIDLRIIVNWFDELRRLVPQGR